MSVRPNFGSYRTGAGYRRLPYRRSDTTLNLSGGASPHQTPRNPTGLRSPDLLNSGGAFTQPLQGFKGSGGRTMATGGPRVLTQHVGWTSPFGAGGPLGPFWGSGRRSPPGCRRSGGRSPSGCRVVWWDAASSSGPLEGCLLPFVGPSGQHP